MTDSKELDPSVIKELLGANGISTLFQPVVSIDKKKVVGFEAFSRGKLAEKEITLKPSDLFEQDWPAETMRELDSHCCSLTLIRFRKFLDKLPGLFLFLNIEATVLEHIDVNDHFLFSLVSKAELPPKNVIVELGASKLNLPHVREFIDKCRDEGFQLSIDQVHRKIGILELILEFRPDYIKLGRDIWKNEGDTTYTNENLAIIARACERIACESVAVGVEKEDEALHLLKCKMYQHQGYFYTSGGAKDEGGIGGFNDAIKRVNDKFREMHKSTIADRKSLFEKRRIQVSRINSKFKDVNESEFPAIIKSVMGNHEDVVSVFILDEHGVQVTPRLGRGVSNKKPKAAKALYTTGQDHSLQDYYLYPVMGYEQFVTPPFLSPFSEKEAVINSFKFFCGLKRYFILCIEFPAI